MTEEERTETHDFVQLQGVLQWQCAVCFKWPDHHSHHDDGASRCTCDNCNSEGTTIY